ncbi:MAG: cation:proton antiporter [Candidatus Hodarchaeales archaeon]|jgi:Kef-type K+ transport system membrane component KefB
MDWNLITSAFDEAPLLILIFEIGVIIIISLVFAKVLGKRGVPQVLGLIFGGFLLQFLTFYTGFPSPPTEEIHYIITTGALGFIGYSIGAHLDLRKLRDASWGLPLILVGEAFGAFIIVTLVISIIFNDFLLGILLGSISMATAPASTSEVIREYNAHGSLSQTILFIIAFDDILAIIFFNIALSYSESILSAVNISLLELFFPIIIELVGSTVLGIILALLMKPFHIEGVEAYQSAEFVFPSVLICIALAGLLHLSVILSCIIFGLALSTMARCENKSCIRGVERLAVPIIALFFILVGFEIDLTIFITPTIFGILIYFVARSLGKSFGAYSTALISKSPSKVTRNLPYALLTQAGVALGLAAYAYTRLISIGANNTALLILDIIAVSVLIAEVIGPLLLKKALFNAGEIKDTKLQRSELASISKI